MTPSERFLPFASMLIPTGSRVLVALSGGADSVCLLHLLAECQEELGLTRLAAAHYHHGLRADADSDAELSRAIADRLGVGFFIGYGDVPTEVKRQKRGIEEVARAMRYAYLRELAAAEDFTHICTAHTANDNLETVVLNLLRGAGLDGMRGILPSRCDSVEKEESPIWNGAEENTPVPIVRPLLEFTRADVEAAIRGSSLFYANDESNLSLNYTRNRIRHTVVPALTAIQPLAVERSVVMVSHLREDSDFLTDLATDVFKKLVIPFEKEFAGYDEGMPPESQVALDALGLSAQHTAIASRIFRHWWSRVTGSTEGLTTAHVEALLHLCKSIDVHAQTSLPQGITAWRSFGWLYMGRPKAPAVVLAPPTTPMPLPIDGTVVTAFPGWKISCRRTVFAGEKTNTYSLRDDAIYGQLRIKLRGGDEKFAPVGRPTRPLKKWLSEAQWPLEARDALPLIADDLGLLLLPGLGVDRRVEPLEGDGVFEVTMIAIGT